MPVLSKKEIIEKIRSKKLKFSPSLDSFQIRMHSVDLRLGYKFLVPKVWDINETGRVALNIDYLTRPDKKYFEVIKLKPGQYFEILPREFIVVETLEKISMPFDMMAVLYPRSSVNRRGLSVDMSGIIDAGYEGSLIIPVRNSTISQIIRVYPGERFCQLVFHALQSEVSLEPSRYAKKSVFGGSLREKSDEEIEYIAKGKVAELKSKYGLITQ